MHCTLAELLALPMEYYETLIEIAPTWLRDHTDES
jgi:hypothetical protein